MMTVWYTVDEEAKYGVGKSCNFVWIFMEFTQKSDHWLLPVMLSVYFQMPLLFRSFYLIPATKNVIIYAAYSL